MIRVASRRVARTDYWLVLVVLALVVLGLVMVYSASYHFPFVSEKYEAQPPNYFLRRQIIFALVGLAGMVILARVDYQLYRRFAVLILVATVVILVVMAPLGRWLLRSQRSVQPAEAAKVGVMIYMSVWLASKGEEIRHLTLGLMPFAFLLMFLCVLVVLQPDFSTAALLVATASAMLLVAGADVRGLLVWLLFVCAVLMPVSVIAPYVFIRIRSWLGSPLRASVGEGFQLMQSLGALQKGGWLGVGLGQSEQKLALYAPHSDCIFAVIGEELGFVGAGFVVALYGLWTWRGLRIAWYAQDAYGMLLAVGIVAWVTFQAALHIGALTDAMPLTGTVLPFVSSGGSSLTTSLASVGILLSVAHGSRSEQGTQGS